MACFRPKKAYVNLDGGSPVFHSDDPRAGDLLNLPCGRCIGCLSARKAEWAYRCRNEAQMHESNSFVTLSYDPEHLPIGGVLHHRHFQLWMKRVRKLTDDSLKYFMCGEYGDSFGRAHFHVLLFGYWPSDARLHADGDIRKFTSELLSSCWGRGYVIIEPVGGGVFDYVSGHNVKKAAKLAAVNGDEWRLPGRHCLLDFDASGRLGPVLDEVNEPCVWIPEYSKASSRPGLGESWVRKYWSSIFPQGVCRRRGGFPQAIPRYYLRLAREGRLMEDSFEYVSPEFVERLAAERMEFARSRDPNESSPERLATREFVAVDRYRKRKLGLI